MSRRRDHPAISSFAALLSAATVLLQLLLVSRVHAQGSDNTSHWQTLTGDPPLVVARGGFSGLLQDSSLQAYSLAVMTSVPDVIMWCDVQLTKDEVGICFPFLNMANSSSIANVYPARQSSYEVNGVLTKGFFPSDFTLKELGRVALTQGILSRSNKFDGNASPILTVEDVANQVKPPGLWLNIEHDSFYSERNLSMRNFVLTVSRRVVVSYISSPEVKFLRSIASRVSPKVTKLVFRFLEQDDTEPSTNQTYGSLMSNLTFIKTFASGILVPKSYIWPVDSGLYLESHTSLVKDAHKEGLEIFASGFANDFVFAYNYSYDPVAEYLSFVDNGDFSVDGVLSDFPITPSNAFDCFAHVGRKAKKQVELLVISKFGASGDFPGCTDKAYEKAIRDGADIIDCPVQMSKDGIPFCLSSIDLANSTTVVESPFINSSTSAPEIQPRSSIYTFSLTWSQIQSLKPSIANPYSKGYQLFRNPRNKNAGKYLTLADFLDLTKNSSSLSGVLISIENAAYLAKKQGLGVVKAVLDALEKSGYDKLKSKRVMIESTDSSVLMEFKAKSNYERVYKIDENIRDLDDSAVEDIKGFAGSVVVQKTSIFPVSEQFILSEAKVVKTLQSAKLPVYVETFSNEFVSQAWDFFSDGSVEINSYVQGAVINGVVTDFPATSARYRKNRCLGMGKDVPQYMSPVQPGGLLQLVAPQQMPPAEAPHPVLTESDVAEPPLPPVTAKVPSASPGTGATAPTPPNAQSRATSCLVLSSLATFLVAFLLF